MFTFPVWFCNFFMKKAVSKGRASPCFGGNSGGTGFVFPQNRFSRCAPPTRGGEWSGSAAPNHKSVKGYVCIAL